MNEEFINNTEHSAEDETSNLKRQFTTVTSLSKYLALVLFISLPFIGGWVGYNYAPGKVVEIENIVEVKNEDMILESDSSRDLTETPPVLEVSYYPREVGPGPNDSNLLSWSAWPGRVSKVYNEDDQIYLLVDRLEIYSNGGSCKSINGICIVNNDENKTLLELAEGAYLTMNHSCVDYENFSGYIEYTEVKIREDGTGVETGCSIPFDSVDTLPLKDLDYLDAFWFDFNEQGQVKDVVRQYLP